MSFNPNKFYKTNEKNKQDKLSCKQGKPVIFQKSLLEAFRYLNKSWTRQSFISCCIQGVYFRQYLQNALRGLYSSVPPVLSHLFFHQSSRSGRNLRECRLYDAEVSCAKGTALHHSFHSDQKPQSKTEQRVAVRCETAQYYPEEFLSGLDSQNCLGSKLLYLLVKPHLRELKLIWTAHTRRNLKYYPAAKMKQKRKLA